MGIFSGIYVYHLRVLCYMPAGIILYTLILCYLCKLWPTSGTFVLDMIKHLTCAPESGPLIGSPVREVRVAGESVNLELLMRADVFVNM